MDEQHLKTQTTFQDSYVLSFGRTPAEWVAALAARGIAIKERTLREKANRLGACYKLGNAMLIIPSQMDNILMESKECRSTSAKEAACITPSVGLNTTGGKSLVHIAAARTRLQRLARGTG